MELNSTVSNEQRKKFVFSIDYCSNSALLWSDAVISLLSPLTKVESPDKHINYLSSFLVCLCLLVNLLRLVAINPFVVVNYHGGVNTSSSFPYPAYGKVRSTASSVSMSSRFNQIHIFIPYSALFLFSTCS